MELFFVEGIRHHAVVLAENESEAVKLAVGASEARGNSRVLYGHIDEWEVPTAYHLVLPLGYQMVKKSGLQSVSRSGRNPRPSKRH